MLRPLVALTVVLLAPRSLAAAAEPPALVGATATVDEALPMPPPPALKPVVAAAAPAVAFPARAATTAAPDTTLPWAAGLAVLALAGAALTLRWKKTARTSRLQVLETVAVGPKRGLSLVRVDGEVLLVAASEAGITLLPLKASAQDAAAPTAGPTTPPKNAQGSEPAATTPGAAAGLLNWMQKGRAAAAPRVFESDLSQLEAELDEDVLLRRKLARGLSARVSP